MHHIIAAVIACSFAISLPVLAAEATGAGALPGFYGGVSVRNAGTQGQGLALGSVSSAWSRAARRHTRSWQRLQPSPGVELAAACEPVKTRA